jgi:branched-chain amino acid transport system ATP-binding protein
MHMVRHIADWVVVMAEGPPVDVMKDPAVIDAYLGAHHDVDLGDTEGIKALEQELAADEESIVGTEDAGIIAVDIVAPTITEAGPVTKAAPDTRRTDDGRTDAGSTAVGQPEKDKE